MELEGKEKIIRGRFRKNLQGKLPKVVLFWWRYEIAIFEYLGVWYNRKRRHSVLGYLTPQEFEEMLNTKKTAA